MARLLVFGLVGVFLGESKLQKFQTAFIEKTCRAEEKHRSEASNFQIVVSKGQGQRSTEQSFADQDPEREFVSGNILCAPVV